MRGTATPLTRGPFSLTLPDTAGPLTIPADGSGSGLSDDLLPWVENIDVIMTAVSHVNWDSIAAAGSFMYNGNKSSSGAQNDEISFDVVLAAGTWTLEMIYYKGNTSGIYTFQLDGVSIGTIDSYLAGVSYVNRSQITGVVVTGSGKKRLRIIMATKNASSTGYLAVMSHIQIKRTA